MIEDIITDSIQQYRECLVKVTEEQLAKEHCRLYRIYYEEQTVFFRQVIQELINKCNEEIAMRWAEHHIELFK